MPIYSGRPRFGRRSFTYPVITPPHQTGGRPLPYADPVTADGGMQTFFVYPARFAGVRRRPSDEDEQVAAMYISSWHVL